MDIKSVVIGIAVMILSIFVVVYGISLFYEKPEYDDFCGRGNYFTEEDCIAAGGTWEYSSEEGLKEFKSCDLWENCQNEYEEARRIYSKRIFLITLPLGILIIALGTFLFRLESVGVGIMGGGVGTLIYGIGGYWSYAQNLLRFLISLLSLIALIYVAYKFNDKLSGKKKKVKKKRKKK